MTKEKALHIIREHLMQRVSCDFEIQDGLPEGCIIYGVTLTEPCWTAWIPSAVPRIGSSRIICLSKKTGHIIYDGFTNEE